MLIWRAPCVLRVPDGPLPDRPRIAASDCNNASGATAILSIYCVLLLVWFWCESATERVLSSSFSLRARVIITRVCRGKRSKRKRTRIVPVNRKCCARPVSSVRRVCVCGVLAKNNTTYIIRTNELHCARGLVRAISVALGRCCGGLLLHAQQTDVRIIHFDFIRRACERTCVRAAPHIARALGRGVM